jgi:fatty acid desaturase
MKPEKKRVQVLDDVKNSDFTAARNEYHFRTPFLVDRLTPLLRDQRDLPMLCLLLNILQYIAVGMTVVYGIALWKPELPMWVKNLAGLLYVVGVLLLFQERFTLCIHFASHRAIFYNEYLNQALGWLLAPFFGIPCGIYKLHHVVMHHIENNHELDISSTEFYQRDSWLNFLDYWLHFSILIWVELPLYTIRTKRWSWFRAIVAGLSIWSMGIFLLARYVSTVATVWMFVVPHVVAMSAMAFGNWAQHIFVNPEDRFSNYALTYNCIDTPVNQTTFNDGYHIIHHLNARLHWADIPQYFYETREKHLEGNAITFRGLHFMDVGILVMTKQLRKLAESYVHLGSAETAPTVEAVEERLRAWLRPCPRGEQTGAAKAAKKAK